MVPNRPCDRLPISKTVSFAFAKFLSSLVKSRCLYFFFAFSIKFSVFYISNQKQLLGFRSLFSDSKHFQHYRPVHIVYVISDYSQDGLGIIKYIFYFHSNLLVSLSHLLSLSLPHFIFTFTSTFYLHFHIYSYFRIVFSISISGDRSQRSMKGHQNC